MNQKLECFNRQKKYLVCIDSDGSAMDTMDSKHIYCFGPAAVEVYHLENYRGLFLTIWKKINLYTMTRGINRFKGLVIALEQLKELGVGLEDFTALKTWSEEAQELSNTALEAEIEETNDPALKKALEWSKLTNYYIKGLEVQAGTFNGVKESIKQIHEVADIVIVSSANSEALEKEWTEEGLSDYVDLLMGQEAGSKSECIAKLKEKGYEEEEILMVGDAPLDLKAAESNKVFYYPILVRREESSWVGLRTEGIKRLQEGTFKGEYQDNLINAFYENLKAGE